MSGRVRDDAAHQSDTRIIAIGAGGSIVGKLVGRGMTVGGQVFLARLLGPAAFGLYALGWTLVRISATLAHLGLDKGVMRWLATSFDIPGREGQAKGLLVDALLLSFVSAGAIGAAFYISAPFLAYRVFAKPDLLLVFRLFAPAMALAAVLRVCVSSTWAARRIRYGVLLEDVGQPALQVLLLVVLVYVLHGGLAAAVSSAVVSYAVVLALALYVVMMLYRPVLSRQVEALFAKRELLRFSIPAALAGAIPVLVGLVDRIVVGIAHPAEAVGVYQAASQVSVIFAVVISAFGGGLVGPLMARLHEHGEIARLREVFTISTKWGLYASLPIFVVLAFEARDLLEIVYGQGYARGSVPLIICSCAGLINAGTGPVGLLLVMSGHQNKWFVISAAALLLDILLQSVLTPRFGIIGAASGTATATAAMFAMGIIVAHRVMGIVPYDRRFAKGLLATLVAAACLGVFQLMTITSAALRVMLSTGIVFTTFAVTLVLAGLDHEDIESLRLARMHHRSIG